MPTPRQHTADHSDIAALQQRLMQAADKLSALAPKLALARQVREYDSDRRKRVLAVVMAPLLEHGSAAAAEAAARASKEYQAEMGKLGGELAAAEKVIAEHDAIKIQWESARSLLAMQRDMTRQL